MSPQPTPPPPPYYGGGGSGLVTPPPQDPLVEQEINPSGPEGPPPDAGGYEDAMADVSSKQFRFNPPIHGSGLSRRPDMSTTTRSANEAATDRFYDERSVRDYRERWKKDGFNTLRLGRIIMNDKAPGPPSLMKYRWGFRFLYNPSTVTTASSRNDSFIIDPRAETNVVITGIEQNFQTISFPVLLDRMADVNSGIPDRTAYAPTLSDTDRRGILRYGTHWDLEALLRVCNGEWNLTDRGKSANMGMLMPSNSRLILGPHMNFYGFVLGITWTDEMFSRDMVPIRTRLDITFRRNVDMTAEDAEKSFPGIASSDTGEANSGDESGNGVTDDGKADNYQGNKVRGPVPGYNTVTTPYGKKGSMWSSGYHTGDDYGLGGIAGKEIVSVRDGTVRFAGRGNGSSWAGYHVVIVTGDVEHWYCHMRNYNGDLKPGKRIAAGTYLGKVGSTGNSSGNHLHYAERSNGSWRKPVWGNR